MFTFVAVKVKFYLTLQNVDLEKSFLLLHYVELNDNV
jgi:hypothetical protein